MCIPIPRLSYEYKVPCCSRRLQSTRTKADWALQIDEDYPGDVVPASLGNRLA